MPRLPLLLLVASLAAACGAEEVTLKSGAVLRGKIVQNTAGDRELVTLQMDEGVLTLSRDQIAKVSTEQPASSEYRRRAPSAPDTVESQWALAMWCRENNLSDELKRHLQRVIELSPNHEEARALLGYQREGEQWLTRDDTLSARGLIRHEGEFRTQQEIELVERARLWKQLERDWQDKLVRWRRHLTRGSRVQQREATTELVKLRDPLAGSAFAKWMLTEQDPAMLRVLLQTALQIPSAAPLEAMAELSLGHRDPEIRQDCLEQLAKAPSAGLTSRYVKGLRSNDNYEVNRSAYALGYLQAEDAIGPLIDALITKHKVKTEVAESGGDTYSVSSDGGFSMGGKKPPFVIVEARNPDALSALVALTHKNFNFDQEQWKNWLAAQAQLEQVSIRRDE